MTMSTFPQVNPGLQKLVSAAFGLQYGLIMVIVCGAELFTGNTAIMTAAFWEGKATAGQVFKNLVVSYAGEPRFADNPPPLETHCRRSRWSSMLDHLNQGQGRIRL